MSGVRLHIVGQVYNFVTHAGGTPFEQLHKEGLTFVAMDSRAFPHWGGDTMTDQWILRRIAHRRLAELQPWPETGWRFGDEATARNAYQTVRQHIISRLPGVEMREDKNEDRELVDPNAAWAESFFWRGSEVVFLACDRTNDALATTLVTMGVSQFTNPSGPETRNASFSTQTSGMYLAVAPGGGPADHVAVIFSPADETEIIGQGLPNMQSDPSSPAFEVDVPTGLLVVAWGRVAGAPLFAQSHGHDPAGVINGFLGNTRVRPVPTTLDKRAAGALAYAIRVNPGVYTCEQLYVETQEGISLMLLSRQGAQPF